MKIEKLEMNDNKKNVLLISTIISTPNANKGTSVCNYFAKEWHNAGHNVIVIYLHTNYPVPLYWIGNISMRTVESKTGAIVYKKPDYKKYHYISEGVDIYQIPVFKFIPHRRYTRKSIDKALNDIVNFLRSRNFIPNVITGHFPNPQIEIVSRLKGIYPMASTAVVMHGYNEQIRHIYKTKFEQFKLNIDIWGFRSKAIQNDFIKRYGVPTKSFICYSGIPNYYFENIPNKEIAGTLRKFIYCGALIGRKHPEKVLMALDKVYPDNNFILTYIGSGGELDNIKKLAAGRNNIRFIGQVPRREMIAELDSADCMIMISESEAFGLVYLEAMARGCITIASRNEGMDGIIIDGENGFLCEAGNVNDLSNKIKYINSLDSQSLNRIIESGILTAQNLSDEKVAEKYLSQF